MNVELHNKILKSSAIGHMVSSIEYPAVILNSNHRIVLTNKAFRSLTGYTDEDILGLPPRILTPNNYSETDRQALRHSLSVLKNQPRLILQFVIKIKNYPK